MEKVWVKILQTLRAENNHALFGLVSTIDDFEFGDQQITIRTHNPAEFQILSKHRDVLQRIAGDVLIQIEDRTQEEAAEDREYVEKLRELFGDKIEIL